MENKSKCRLEIFSRVTGFYRPIQAWNPGKQEEFKDREHYEMDTMTEKKDESIEDEAEECTADMS